MKWQRLGNSPVKMKQERKESHSIVNITQRARTQNFWPWLSAGREPEYRTRLFKSKEYTALVL